MGEHRILGGWRRKGEKKRRLRTELGPLGDPHSQRGEEASGRKGQPLRSPAAASPNRDTGCRARAAARRRDACKTSRNGAGPRRAGPGRAGGAEGGGTAGGGAGAARGGVSAEAAGAATAPGSGSGGRAMWLLGPLCLLLSSAAGESGGVRRTSCGARSTAAGLQSRPFPAPRLRLRVRVCTEGGPRAGLAGTPARGRGGVRAVLLCGRARRLLLCCVCAGGALCAAGLWGARQLPRLGVARVSLCAVCVGERRKERGEERTLPRSHLPRRPGARRCP